MKKLLSLILLSLAAACVTSSDLARLQDTQLRFESAVQASMENDARSNEAKLQDIRDANAVRLAEVGGVIKDVEDRTKALASVASAGPLGIGSVLTELLAGLAVTGVGTYVAVNKKRDKKYALPAGVAGSS